MSLLTKGLAAVPSKTRPPAVLCRGLGGSVPLTANSPYTNTPIFCFYSAPKSEAGDYTFTFNDTDYEGDLSYGRVQRTAEGAEVDLEGGVSSFRPYINYGTSFKCDPTNLKDGAEIKFEPKSGLTRIMGHNGDPEYAVMTPDANSVYNARSVVLILPENVVLTPRSLSRLRFYLKRVFPGSVNLRVKRNRGAVELELLGDSISVNSVQTLVDNVYVNTPLSRRYDVVTYQVYTGME